MLHLFRSVLGLLAGLLLLVSSARGQGTAGYGDWQLHLPTGRPQQLADAGDRVYVVARNAFYFLDKNQNTTQVLSSRDGLSDVGVVAAAYDSVTRQTVLAYGNGNLDILRPNGSIRNLNDILRKSIQGAKTISRITVAGSKAYLSTTFGLVVVDLVKLEISDSYSNIGPGGALLTVNDAAVSGGYLFLATSTGVLRGKLTDNLLDYRSWVASTPLPTGPRPVTTLTTYAGQVYAASENSDLYKFVASSGTWAQVGGTYSLQARRLCSSSAGILISEDIYGVRLLSGAGVVTNIMPASRVPNATTNDAIRTRDGSYYVASSQGGFQRIPPGAGAAIESYVANGPATSYAFSLLADARTNIVDIFTGGYSERYQPAGMREGFYEYANGQWSNFNPPNLPGNTNNDPFMLGPVRGARTPDGTLYVGGNGGGLLEWKGPGQVRQFGLGFPTGSPLLDTFGGGNNRVEITDLATTPEGKLWVVNRHLNSGRSGLFLFDPTANTWQTMPYALGLEALERIALDDNGYAWVSVSRKTDPTGAPLGIYAVDPSLTTPNPPRFFNTTAGLPANEIYELAKDRRGYIWAATIKGVAVFNDPSGPFLSQLGFSQPIVRRGEGTGFPALFSEAVRCLAVDGGDRKWFGTDNGLWLFSADADEALLHFTTANSPLPSNRIVDVKVNDKTGDVWVATDAGVVAYRGSATVTDGAPSCAAVFPNPVRPDFAGTVGIRGVANNGLVKITDVAGHLVYATTAAGGTVTWNLNNPNGERVRSGIYLVLSSDADGKNGCVSKVAVLSK